MSAPVTLGAAAAPASHASVSPRRDTVVLGATTTPSSGDGGGAGGTFGATSLKPAGSWSAGGSSGSFSYSYPINVPPAASSLGPDVALSYDSGGIDGQTATTGSQADWVGDGWSTPENFVEQSFVSCSDKPEGVVSSNATSDVCYDGPVLTLSLNGMSTSLVCSSNCNSGSAKWKSAEDDGEVVTHHVNTDNGSGTHNTDYWTVTDRRHGLFLRPERAAGVGVGQAHHKLGAERTRVLGA